MMKVSGFFGLYAIEFIFARYIGKIGALDFDFHKFVKGDDKMCIIYLLFWCVYLSKFTQNRQVKDSYLAFYTIFNLK